MRYYTEDPKTFGTTILVMVPTLLSYLLTTDSINPECHTVLVGAAPCGDHVLKAIREKGIRVSFGYGLSETASGLAISVGSDDPFALDLCPDTTCRISEEGEVLISTPCMMEGYWHRPEETAEALKNGVLYTGDLGEIDENGRLRLKGRKNDVLVLSNGEKIFCPEWEEQLAKELGPEIAVILYQDAPALVIGNGGPEADAAKVVDRFNAGQSISKRIKYIQVVDGPLPRTATGKLRRWKVEELLS
jgi:long-subunit acyl-CoA synthetase (AMP-forming)